MVQALGNEQAAEEEKGRHGYIGAPDEVVGESLKRIFMSEAVAMGEDNEDGACQPDQVKIIAFFFVQLTAQSPASGEPFSAEQRA